MSGAWIICRQETLFFFFFFLLIYILFYFIFFFKLYLNSKWPVNPQLLNLSSSLHHFAACSTNFLPLSISTHLCVPNCHVQCTTPPTQLYFSPSTWRKKNFVFCHSSDWVVAKFTAQVRLFLLRKGMGYSSNTKNYLTIELHFSEHHIFLHCACDG